MKTVSLSKFKAKCIGLLTNDQKTKERIVVTVRG